jgi:hypothetical protein
MATSIAHGITEFTNTDALAQEISAADAHREEGIVSTPVCSAIISASVSASVDNTFDHGC